MPEPISSTNQCTNYTPVEPEPEEPLMCLAPEEGPAGEPADAEPEPRFKTTYGDGKIHREGFGFRVDPSATTTGKVSVLDHDVELTMTGVDTLVAATTKNVDGSKGARLSASANIIQGTATIPNGNGGEVTVGVGVGVGFDASSGTRDSDSDGEAELCVRAAWRFFVVGGCSETIPALIDKAKEALSR